MNPRIILRPTALTAAALGIVVCQALPAAAVVSGSVSPDGILQISSDAAADVLSTTCAGGQAVVAGVPVGPCSSVQAIVTSDGGGADTVNLSSVTRSAFPGVDLVYISSGAGTDTLRGSEIDDYIEADPGELVDGGAGDDQVFGGGPVQGGAGDDVIVDPGGNADGGAGDDRVVVNTPTMATYSGGAGTDVMEFDATSIGPLPYEIEWRVTPDALTLTPTGVPPVSIPMTQFERYVIETPGSLNPQNLESTTYAGGVSFTGGTAADRLNAGPGADDLRGRGGNDSINPGAGADTVAAGSGDDTVLARDGVADTIQCGDGTDTVVADAADTVSGCESVDVPPVVQPPAAQPETGAVAGKKKVAKGAKLALTLSSPTAGATFECSVDGKAWKACPAAYKLSTKKLKLGKHHLAVRAVAGGKVDPTPSTFTFRVVR